MGLFGSKNQKLFANVLKEAARSGAFDGSGPKRVEYMCTHCGTRRIRNENDGRPSPDRCPRRSGDQPHRWVINRKL